MDNKIYILGVGNNTPVYIDLVEACGYTVGGLYHYNRDRQGEIVCGIPIIDSNAELFARNSLEGLKFAVSVGDNKNRTSLSNKIRSKGGEIPTLIHPSAVVSKYANISLSVIIQANSVVQAGAIIEDDTVLSYNSSVSHSSRVGKSCYLAFTSSVGAYVNIGNNVLVGQGAILISGKASFIGDNAIIGAGSVVTKTVASNTTVVGNPAVAV